MVETSVYVAPESAGRGVGRALVEHQVRAAVREVGIRERIAQRDGLWHDTVLIEFRASTP